MKRNLFKYRTYGGQFIYMVIIRRTTITNGRTILGNILASFLGTTSSIRLQK